MVLHAERDLKKPMDLRLWLVWCCTLVRKSHKRAIVAVAHKMIRLIFLMLTRRQPYIDQAIDYAAMSAKKNAPRWIKQLKTIGRWPTSKPAAAVH